MNTSLKAKLIQNLSSKNKGDEGFTLIELLVVIIIIGILSAIALPSFLNQANKAKQSEAKTIVGSMNRAQQTYYLENNEFADKDGFGGLGLGVKTETDNYKYEISGGGTGKTLVTNQAQLKAAKSALKAYIGGVTVGTVKDTNEATTIATLCEGLKPGSAGGKDGKQDVTATANEVKCPADYKSLSS